MKVIYAVIGVGALGGVMGGLLLKAGCTVHLLARSDFTQLKSDGLYLETKSHSNATEVDHFKNVNVHCDISTIPLCDIVLLTTKTYSNCDILPLLRFIIKPETIIVILQNGLNVEQEVMRQYANPILITAAWIKATKLAPGKYRHDFGGLIQASVCNRQNQALGVRAKEFLRIIIADFRVANLTLTVKEDVHCEQWTKLALNLPFFALSIIHNSTSDELLKDITQQKTLHEIRSEIAKVAEVYGYTIDEKFIDGVCEQLKITKLPTSPSMKNDYDAGKQLEIESSFGEVVKLADAKCLKATKLKAAYNSLKLIEVGQKKNRIVVRAEMQNINLEKNSEEGGSQPGDQKFFLRAKL